MIVTGVQAAGSKGLNSVQVAAVDTKEVARLGGSSENDREGARRVGVKAGEPAPVHFPRQGVPLDQRPVALKKERALQMYAAYGGDRESDEERNGR